MLSLRNRTYKDTLNKWNNINLLQLLKKGIDLQVVICLRTITVMSVCVAAWTAIEQIAICVDAALTSISCYCINNCSRQSDIQIQKLHFATKT